MALVILQPHFSLNCYKEVFRYLVSSQLYVFLIAFPFLFTQIQAKDRQKKRTTKGIRVDEEGDAFFEDEVKDGTPVENEDPFPEPEETTPVNKKVWGKYLFISFVF